MNALELAAELEDEHYPWPRFPAAAELRRLDAECNDLAHQLNQSNERNGRLIAQRDAIQQVVDEQAEDEGLWFRAQTAAEAYLQQALRRLHAAVEGEK